MTTNEHEDLLGQIQMLALAGARQTGCRIVHEVIAWDPDGDPCASDVWSTVRVVSGSGDCLHESRAIVIYGDDAVPEYDTQEGRCTLLEQRDQLTRWIAANRKTKGVDHA